MKNLLLVIMCHVVLLGALDVHAAPPVGAAPKGDAKKVATKIIKRSFPNCKRVTSALRVSDGSIIAKCDGIEYRVFTMYDAEEGKVLELALNCKEAKAIGVACY